MTNQNSPLVGVLCIDISQKLSKIYGEKIKSYISASYVKFLESAGARVVPIWIGRSFQYYQKMLSKINGLLIPGGAVFFDEQEDNYTKEFTNECVQSSKFIYEIATQENDKGKYFPIWGTCLGFQLLLYHSTSEGYNVRRRCEALDCMLPLDFVEDLQSTKMFANIDETTKIILIGTPFAYHYHAFCVTKDDLINCKVDNEWRILATNKDSNGLEFISLIEHKRFPFFGAQFHPECIAYEYCGTNDPCLHSADCIKAAQYLANFFVDACRKCENQFDNFEEELKYIIWNYAVTFTGVHGVRRMQCYLFED